MRRILFTLSMGLGATAVSAQASAQEATGFASSTYHPSEAGSRFFALDTLDLRGSGRMALALRGDYSYRSVVDYRPDGAVAASIVRNQLISHFGAAFNFGGWMRLGLAVPLQLYADGAAHGGPAVIGGRVYRSPGDSTAVGDVRVAADARIFGRYGEALTGTFGIALHVPSGNPRAYSGDGEPRVAPRFMVAGSRGDFVYAGKAALLVRGRDEPYGEGRIGTEAQLSAAGGLRLLDERFLVGPEVLASTVLSKNHAFEAKTTPVEVLLGAHYDVVDSVRVGAAVGAGMTRAYGTPVFRSLLAVEWVPGSPKPEDRKDAKADRDGDGVPDVDDACGFVAGPKSKLPEQNGCPLADADGDGVPDEADACRLVPGERTGRPETLGCPGDRDGDGVADPDDACPDQRGPRGTDPKSNGCPVKDSDGDGVLDDVDACRDASGVMTHDPKTNGCPDLDPDRDGVLGPADACPNDTGPADADPKRNGCPLALFSGPMVRLAAPIRFRGETAELVPDQPILAALAALFKEHPDSPRVRVEGHTDNQGSAAANKAKGLARAEAVVRWLVAHGVDKSRVTAQGVGGDRPVDSNDTEPGRANNRRVELHVEGGVQ